MPVPVFSDSWAAACAAVLNQNAAYRAAAASWEGALLLQMSTNDGVIESRLVFLDLWHGECRLARSGTPSDEGTARYILAGEHTAWRQVLTGQTPPLMAIMTGKLRLTKGSIMELLPYVAAAKELVLAAATVEATFPGEE
jgi:putative sterol carrier protein